MRGVGVGGTQGAEERRLAQAHHCSAGAATTTTIARVPLLPDAQKKKSSSWSLRFLVGTAQGDVKAFDPQLGELVWRAQACVAG